VISQAGALWNVGRTYPDLSGFGEVSELETPVAYTGTLVIAMVVHAIYDFVAGYRISREAIRFETEIGVAV
jgi:hypothetical protein